MDNERELIYLCIINTLYAMGMSNTNVYFVVDNIINVEIKSSNDSIYIKLYVTNKDVIKRLTTKFLFNLYKSVKEETKKKKISIRYEDNQVITLREYLVKNFIV